MLMFYENYKKSIFLRFTLSKNISVSIFPNKFFLWLESTNTKNSFFSVLGKFELSTKINCVQKHSLKKSILNVLFLKKKFGFFKKNNKLIHVNLYRLNFLKNLSNNKSFKNKFFKKKFRTSKFIDFKFNSFRIFYQNRVILKNLMFLKKMKQQKTTRFLSKITKQSLIDFSSFFEFSLFSLLIKSKICNSFSESLFFINNGLVFVNGKKSYNPFFQINVGDVIQISLSDKIFNFFKINFNKKVKILNTLKYIIWKNHRFRNNFYKQPYNRVPNWVSDISFFYEDVPTCIDVDYSVMSFCILHKNIKNNFFKKSFLKNINMYMLRNYNWNYLI